MLTLSASADELTRDVQPPLASKVAGILGLAAPKPTLASLLEANSFVPRTALPSVRERQLGATVDIGQTPPGDLGACVGYLAVRPNDGTHLVPDGIAIIRSGPYGPYQLAEVSDGIACATGRYRRVAYSTVIDATSAGRRLVTELQKQVGISSAAAAYYTSKSTNLVTVGG